MHSSWSHPAVLQVCTSYENVNSSVLFALFFVLLALLRAMCLDLWLSIVSFCVFIAVAVLVSSFFSISHTVYVPPFHLLYSCTYFALRLWFSDASTWIFLPAPPLSPHSFISFLPLSAATLPPSITSCWTGMNEPFWGTMPLQAWVDSTMHVCVCLFFCDCVSACACVYVMHNDCVLADAQTLPWGKHGCSLLFWLLFQITVCFINAMVIWFPPPSLVLVPSEMEEHSKDTHWSKWLQRPRASQPVSTVSIFHECCWREVVAGDTATDNMLKTKGWKHSGVTGGMARPLCGCMANLFFIIRLFTLLFSLGWLTGTKHPGLNMLQNELGRKMPCSCSHYKAICSEYQYIFEYFSWSSCCRWFNPKRQ